MNARNAFVAKENSSDAIQLVNGKQDTKKVLEEADLPVPSTLLLIENGRDIKNLDWEALPDGWILKPNRGRQGTGILIAAGRDGEGWQTFSGRHLGRDTIKEHLRFTIDGEYSYEGVERDSAFFEPLLKAHPALAGLVPSGLPDVRLICRGAEVLLCMMRLPTGASDGRANLHRGAIGALVDLDSGCITRALFKNEPVEEHPDTGERLVSVKVPGWEEMVDAASRCSEVTGLGYLGVDAVVDEERSPLIMEVNARPGLEIQNVAGIGLAKLLSDMDNPRGR